MKTDNDVGKRKKKSQTWWLICIILISFCLSLFFGMLSELVLTTTGIILSVFIILIFVAISMFSDMIGVAVTAADPMPFHSMSAQKLKGGKEALFIIKHADKVATICCDVIGDVCGILAGAAGATIILKIAFEGSSLLTIFISTLVSAIIATLTIFGKAIMKKYAIKHSTQILTFVGKFLSIFGFVKKTKTK